MKPEEDIERFLKDASVEIDAAQDRHVREQMHQAYARSADQGAASRRPDYWGLAFETRPVRWAAAAVILLALGILVGQFGGMLAGSSVAWAEVTQRFQSIPFFSATIYMKENATAEPRQMELWMSRDGHARARLGSQIVFGRRGQVIQAFDIESRQPVEPDGLAVFFLQKLGEAEVFSLETVIRVMFGSEMHDVTPLVNPDAVISQDVVVFDLDLPNTPEWVRIWALRESRLPIRIRVWDPRDGEVADAILEYSTEQAKEFFDPNAFENLLTGHHTTNRTNMAYAFLKDLGGRQLTPNDMFAMAGYHVPEVQRIGITPDGAVWVTANKGENTSPSGYDTTGFARLEDDLGREYVNLYCAYAPLPDLSVQIFVPEGYPFDKRIPARLTLTCEVGDWPPRREPLHIGTVERTQWEQDALWPAETIPHDVNWLHGSMAWHHVATKRYDLVNAILADIEGEPEDSPMALVRERVRLRMLIQQGHHDGAMCLAQRLMPLLEADYRTWDGSIPNPLKFTDCILALACAGRIEEAGRTWQRIESTQPELGSELKARVRGQVQESIRRGVDRCVLKLAEELRDTGHLTDGQIEQILGANYPSRMANL
jgi:hypothetical protein